MNRVTARYDSIGGAYDLVAGLEIYHRVCWGVSMGQYRAFADKAVSCCGDGVLLDAGCGSMLFTATAHRANERGTLIGMDASLRMLRLARSRLHQADRKAERAVLLNGNLLRSPFRRGAFDVVLCLHVAHVVDDLGGLLVELRRVLRPGGTLFLTSVVLVDHWRDRYLRALSRRGVMAAPRCQSDLLNAVRARFATEVLSELLGSMLFVQATNPG
ncbi:MAG TPA: class I SAM-dependent methyltransferase [Vicinamibacterales bacterium]|jgi:ubiquinone/menaquinone biosynthesis C-methylase UbiE|nr:class I SAM-dependent methyltransferase [Vicinamibacterales bacterium]